MSELEAQRKLILDSQPKHMRILIDGAINMILIHYESELKNALYDLYKTTHDIHDIDNEDLRKAMKNAKLLLNI